MLTDTRKEQNFHKSQSSRCVVATDQRGDDIPSFVSRLVQKSAPAHSRGRPGILSPGQRHRMWPVC